MFTRQKTIRRDGITLVAASNRSLVYLPRKTLLVSVLAGAIGGCGAPKMAPIQPKTMTEFACRTSSGGLEIGVDAWTNADRVKKHFGMDLLSRRIVPFEIAFANEGAEGGFLLQPESAVILDDKSLQEIRSAPGGIRPSSPDATVLGVTYLAISQAGAIILKVLADEGYQDAQDVRRRMNSIEFVDRPLYKSDSNKGFLYLKFGDSGALPEMAAVKFRVKNIRSRQERTLIIPLKGR